MINFWKENESRLFRIKQEMIFEDIETVACVHNVPNQWAFEVFLELIIQGYAYGTVKFDDALSMEVLRLKLSK